MHKTIVLAIGVSFLGGMIQAFDVNEWAPINSVEQSYSSSTESMAERQMKEALRDHLRPIEGMQLRSLRVVAYLKVLSSLCDDTQMQPLERLLWANIAREEIEQRLVSETGVSASELRKSLPRGENDPDGGAELSATARAARLVQESSMDSLDGMEETGTRIFEYMQRSLPDLLTVGKVAVPTGFDMAAHT